LESLRETRPVQLSAAARGHEGLGAVQFRRDAPGETPPLPDLIARYTPPDPPAGDPSLLDRMRCTPDGVPPGKGIAPHQSVAFTPDDLSVGLQPGKPMRVDLKAALTAVPTPLDTYFVIDGSNSSDAARDGIKCSVERLAAELVDHGVDARFGVATFGDRYSRRYQRLLDLEPFGPTLAQTLDNLLPQEGNGTPIRSALYQTATGRQRAGHRPFAREAGAAQPAAAVVRVGQRGGRAGGRRRLQRRRHARPAAGRPAGLPGRQPRDPRDDGRHAADAAHPVPRDG